jgi:hypothetical protein
MSLHLQPWLGEEVREGGTKPKLQPQSKSGSSGDHRLGVLATGKTHSANNCGDLV